MSKECGRCHGDGVCHHSHHDLIEQMAAGGIRTVGGGKLLNPCPACGGAPDEPGQCQKCDGTGELADDD
jgi:hypothetical protein